MKQWSAVAAIVAWSCVAHGLIPYIDAGRVPTDDVNAAVDAPRFPASATARMTRR